MDKYNFSKPAPNYYHRLAWIALLLALGVIMLGAYTRLSDAGLGCPDWPGCYGKLVPPESKHALSQAQTAFPNIPVVAKKAWTEMIHRYFAGTLGLLILVLAIWALVRKRHINQQPLFMPLVLVTLVIFQALLGMWTVTLKLLPIVVMAHLMGGMTIAALLWCLALATKQNFHAPSQHLLVLRPWAIIALFIVVIQIFLGAWTSTNYAALACPNFPFCHGSLFPEMEWSSAFNIMSPIGPNYEGGRLAMDTRVTIHMAHRYGAFITTLYLVPLSLSVILVKTFAPLHRLGWIMLLLLGGQIALGILNIELTLPMWTAVAHNAIAAMLLLAVVTMVFRLCTKRRGNL